jgi:hypothetical protein
MLRIFDFIIYMNFIESRSEILKGYFEQHLKSSRASPMYGLIIDMRA